MGRLCHICRSGQWSFGGLRSNLQPETALKQGIVLSVLLYFLEFIFFFCLQLCKEIIGIMFVFNEYLAEGIGKEAHSCWMQMTEGFNQ